MTHPLSKVIERFVRLPQRAERKVHARPVMREQALVAKCERIDAELCELVDGDGVPRRLRHFHAVGEEMLAVHPVRHRRVTVGALGLRDLVLVVREDVVDAARMRSKSTRLNSSHDQISYAVFCLKKKK